MGHLALPGGDAFGRVRALEKFVEGEQTRRRLLRCVDEPFDGQYFLQVIARPFGDVVRDADRAVNLHVRSRVGVGDVHPSLFLVALVGLVIDESPVLSYAYGKRHDHHTEENRQCDVVQDGVDVTFDGLCPCRKNRRQQSRVGPLIHSPGATMGMPGG